MNVCSYVKETMVNLRKSADANLISTDLPCIPDQLLELDELFRIDLRNHKVAGAHCSSESCGFKEGEALYIRRIQESIRKSSLSLKRAQRFVPDGRFSW